MAPPASTRISSHGSAADPLKGVPDGAAGCLARGRVELRTAMLAATQWLIGSAVSSAGTRPARAFSGLVEAGRCGRRDGRLRPGRRVGHDDLREHDSTVESFGRREVTVRCE